MAWPLSDQAFSLRLYDLEFSLDHVPVGKTKLLLDAFVERFLPLSRGMSIASLHELCVMLWSPPTCSTSWPLHEWQQKIWSRITTSEGAVCSPLVAKIERWRWMSLCLPATLLNEQSREHEGLTQLFAPKSIEECDAPNTQKLSEKEFLWLEGLKTAEVAHQHVHLAAAFSFDTVWLGLAFYAGATGPRYRMPAFSDPRNPQLQMQVLSALLLRLLMPLFCLKKEKVDFRIFLSSRTSPCSLYSYCLAIASPQDAHDLCCTVQSAVLVLQGCGSIAVGRLQWAYRKLGRLPQLSTKERIARSPQTPPRRAEKRSNTALRDQPSLTELSALDPLRIKLLEKKNCVEKCLLSSLGDDIENWLLSTLGSVKNDPLLYELFWQYQRIRCSVFRYVTLQPGTAGLDWFKQAYDRGSELTKNLKATRWHSALALSHHGLALQSLEVRKSPPKNWYEVADDIQSFTQANDTTTEIGITYHFLKEANRSAPSNTAHSAPTNGDWRYGQWYREKCIERNALKSALQKIPNMLTVVRGLDVANNELSQPMWLVQQLLNDVYQESEKTKRCDQRPLQITLHIAEEYRCVAEGLRNISDANRYLQVRRLGHALVLGQIATDQTYTQPREERLWDLLWLRSIEVDTCPDLAPLELEIRTLAKDIFTEYLETGTVQALRENLFCPRFLTALGFPRMPLALSSNSLNAQPYALAIHYLRDQATYRRAIRPIEVTPSIAEVRRVNAAQVQLRTQLQRENIVVETNPTSNLVISDQMGLHRHSYAQSLCDALGNNVDCTINSDDPLTFATRLQEEYIYMYASLRKALGTHIAAINEIDRLRKTSMHSRFTSQ